MGTEHYLIDRERRIAFDCHKWYLIAIVSDDHMAVTAEDIMSTADHEGRCNSVWLRTAAVRWMQWHGIESAELVRDSDWCPPDDFYDAGDRWNFGEETEAEFWARNGWQLCSLWGDVAAEMSTRLEGGG